MPNPARACGLTRRLGPALVCLWVAVGGAQAHRSTFRSYSVEHGLPQSQVETVLQDPRGFLWAGTHHGLARFDGRQFVTYTRKDGLLENVVSAAAVDTGGRLWFGHPSGGVTLLRGERFLRFPVEGSERAGVTAIAEDSAGNVWFGTAGGGLRVAPADERGPRVVAATGGPRQVHDVHAGRSALWIAAAEGLFSAPAGSGSPLSLAIEPVPWWPADAPGVRALWEDGDGRLWAGTEQGVLAIDPRSETVRAVEDLPGVPIEDVLEDGNGTVWVATEKHGVWCFAGRLDGVRAVDLKTFSVREGLSYDHVKEIARDREGNLWFATFGGGLSYYRGDRFETTNHSEDPGVLSVWSILEDRSGIVWLGTDGGLVRLHPEAAPVGSTRVFSTADGLPHRSVRALHQDAEGNLWLATKGGGLVRFDPETERIEVIDVRHGLPTDDLLAVIGGTAGEMWLGTYGHGVVRYRPPADGDLRRGRGSLEHYPIADAGSGCDVYTLLRDRNGTIWAGATGLGLARFLPGRGGGPGSFEVLGEERGLRHLDIDSLAEDHAGLLWISADDGGLYSFDGASFTDIGTGSPLEGEHVYLVAVDKSNSVLAGTNYGLYHYDRQSGEFRYFGRDEGFWGIETNVNARFNDRSGRVWFGTINGATRYNPDADRPNPTPPLTHITGLGVFLEPVPLVHGATFAHDRNHFTFDFIGVSLSAPDRVRYRYMLEGFDQGWLAATERTSATYSNVPPGRYTFKVIAANEHGVWNAHPVTYGFSVRSPFWRSGWFLASCLGGLGLTVVGGHRWRTRSIQQANRRLEASVRERTLELSRRKTELESANEALAGALDQAQQASRAKTDFLANMSHEIRTPMNGVVGMTDLLLDTELTREQREYADTVRKSADALLAIINDVLDFSKIEAGRTELQHVPLDLRQCVEDVAGLLAPRAESKGVELAVRYARGCPHRFIGDPGRIRQVVTNLLGNALKFTEQGHVAVVVEAGPGGEGVTISVEDTGIGIPADKLDAVFEMFTQVDSSATRRYGGTGLGLAISRHLVEQMGGRIEVTSEPGRGSTFSCRLPLPAQIGCAPEPLPVGDLDGVRVLVVDDNEINRRILREQLDGHGVANRCCASGPEALAALREAATGGAPFRIAIVDYQMPGMDGLELARRIRADTDIADTALVMLTSVSARGDVGRAQQAGFASYLVKPVRHADLHETLLGVWGALKQGKQVKPVTRDRLAERPAPGPFRARALVAEDNVVNQRVAARILERLGCRVDLAMNGREAVRMLHEAPYDVVLMDCQMPELDGYEATREIRRRPPGDRRIPIIAMTAHALKGDREKCIEAGMDDYVAKPVTPRALEEVLARWLAAAADSPRPP